MTASYRKESNMKRCTRFWCVFLCTLIFACIFSVSTFAAGKSAICTDGASAGYFTVQYKDADNAKMKVGVTYNKETVYYNYVGGDTSSYTFTKGDGTYTITLFLHVTGTSYTPVLTEKVTVKMGDSLAPYRASTDEITFSKDDAVGRKASELCSGLTDDESKVLAIHNFVADTITYDYDFARKVITGAVKTYVPDTSDILSSKKGICYDFSALFAALCRSQDIPCTIEKGFYCGGYHAWNKVYIDGYWYTLDLTMSSAFKNSDVEALADCIVHMTADSGYSY